MEVLSLLFLFLIPIFAIVFTLRFKGFMSLMLLAPVAMLFGAVVILSADPTITFINSTSEITNVTSTIEPINGPTSNVYHYNVESSTGQVLINTVSSQTQAEFASSSSSVLVGDEIDCMRVWLGKAGTPPEGDITFAVFDGSNNIVKIFGTQTPAAMASSALTPYTHCLVFGDSHTILNGQYIGVNYNLGDAANTITMRVDGNNPFDSTVTYRAQYIAAWGSSTGQDVMMQLYMRESASLQTDIYAYGQQDTETTYTLSGEVATVVYGMTFAVGGLLIFLVFRRVTGEINRE